MLHHLAGATIQVANLVNYYFHQEDGNKFNPQSQNLSKTQDMTIIFYLWNLKIRTTFGYNIMTIIHCYTKKIEFH